MGEAAHKGVAAYPNLYANGSQLYYQVSGAQKLWTISSTGQAEVAATTRTPYYEASAVTSQGTLLLGLDSVSSLMSSGIEVITPDGQRTNLSAFLNQPYYVEGADQLAATDNQAVYTDSSEHTEDIYSNPLKAYTTANGDLVVEIQVVNNLNKECNLFQIKTELSGAAEGEACFYTSTKVSPDQTKVFPLVFPKGTVELKGNLADLETGIILYGNWN